MTREIRDVGVILLQIIEVPEGVRYEPPDWAGPAGQRLWDLARERGWIVTGLVRSPSGGSATLTFEPKKTVTRCYSDHDEDIRTKGSCDYCRSTSPQGG